MQQLCRSAYRDLLSEQQQCALFKMLKFLLNFKNKNAYKLSENVVKRWNADECAERMEQQKAKEELRTGELGDMFMDAAGEAVRFEPEAFRGMLKVPGARTRMAWLMGTKERMEELIGQNMLQDVFRKEYPGRWEGG